MDAADDNDGHETLQHTWVIHGTWSAPVKGKFAWYQLHPSDNRNFCNKLDAALTDGPLAGSVWRDIAAEDVFSWKSANLHTRRIEAGEDLAERIIALRRADTRNRINLVAHSHGGNAVLHACQLYREFLVEQAGKVYDRAEELLGTDFAGSEVGNEDLHSAVLTPEFEHCDPDTLSVYGEVIDAILIKFDYVPDYFDFQNHDRYNQPRRAFINRWLETEMSHVVRNLVFLGTPFLQKEWEMAERGLLSTLRRIFALLWHLSRAMVLSYVVLLFFWSLGALVTLGFLVSAPTLWPAEWEWGTWLVYASIASFPLMLFRVSSRLDYNADLYFDPSRYMGMRFGDHEAPHEFVPTFNALVVTATHLDEAFLGLAAEPLVLAKLAPWLRRDRWDWDTAKAYIRAPRAKARIGVGHRMNRISAHTGTRYYSNALIEGPENSVLRLLTRTLRTLSIAADLLWLPVRRMILEPYSQRLILNAVSGLAFGMTPEELDRARIQARHRINMPKFFDEDHWDLTEDIVKGRITMDDTAVQGATRRAQYGYLVDEEKLNSKMSYSSADKSRFWSAAQEERSVLLQREAMFGYQLADSPEFQHDLARISFSVEERAKELAGTVELNHSVYYNNAAVIAGIAAFLETGARGKGV